MALQLIGGTIACKLSKERIGQAFTRLGFEYKRTNALRGYVAIHRTGAEMEAYRRWLADQKSSDDPADAVTGDSVTPIF
jgi:hypothetical protein